MALKVIVAGLGPRGCDWVREIRSSQGFELAGCVEIDEQVRLNATDSLNIPRDSCFNDLAEAISKTQCQAVIVATSPRDHERSCELAIANSLAVLVEKPFTLRLREAVRLVELAEEKQTPLLVAQNYRYLRSFRTVRRIIDEGKLGRINYITCQYFRPPHQMAASLLQLEHSILYGMSVHHLDALRSILGKEIHSVMAESFAASDESPAGASFRALLAFEDGPRASYFATYESSGFEFFERGQQFYARFAGERGTLHVFQRWLVFCERGKLPRLVSRGKRKITEEQILLQQLERAMLHGESAEVSGRDNLQTMALLEACMQSGNEQKWINPQDLLNEAEYRHTVAGDRH